MKIYFVAEQIVVVLVYDDAEHQDAPTRNISLFWQYVRCAMRYVIVCQLCEREPKLASIGSLRAVDDRVRLSLCGC